MLNWRPSPSEVLFRRAAAIRAVQTGGRIASTDAVNADANIFSQALAKLELVSRRMQSPLAIVGGLAGIYYQSMVTTVDIDVVVARDRLDDFLRKCASEGFEIKRRSEHGWHTVSLTIGEESVEINVVPEGEKSRAIRLTPRRRRAPRNWASQAAWVMHRSRPGWR